MDYITTTELRTKSSQLVQALEKGMEVSLIHRSKVVGVIKPKKESKVLTYNDIVEMKKLIKELKPKKLIPKKDREKIYRKHLEEKYGKALS